MLLHFASSDLVNHLVEVVKLFSVSLVGGLPGAWLVKESLKFSLHVGYLLLVRFVTEQISSAYSIALFDRVCMAKSLLGSLNDGLCLYQIFCRVRVARNRLCFLTLEPCRCFVSLWCISSHATSFKLRQCVVCCV